jgi:hypothetical protein
MVDFAMSKFTTTTRAARRAGVTSQAIRDAVRRGEVEAEVIGDRFAVSESSVERFASRRQVRAGEAFAGKVDASARRAARAGEATARKVERFTSGSLHDAIAFYDQHPDIAEAERLADFARREREAAATPEPRAPRPRGRSRGRRAKRAS